MYVSIATSRHDNYALLGLTETYEIQYGRSRGSGRVRGRGRGRYCGRGGDRGRE